MKQKVKSNSVQHLAYPLNIALAERWKRISVEVIPTHTPFIASVAGSDTQCTCRLSWGDAERRKEREKREKTLDMKATVNPNFRLELESLSFLSPSWKPCRTLFTLISLIWNGGWG